MKMDKSDMYVKENERKCRIVNGGQGEERHRKVKESAGKCRKVQESTGKCRKVHESAGKCMYGNVQKCEEKYRDGQANSCILRNGN